MYTIVLKIQSICLSIKGLCVLDVWAVGIIVLDDVDDDIRLILVYVALMHYDC